MSNKLKAGGGGERKPRWYRGQSVAMPWYRNWVTHQNAMRDTNDKKKQRKKPTANCHSSFIPHQKPWLSCECTGHLPGFLANHREMQSKWNRQRHSSRAMRTSFSNSSRQMVHSALSMQSFSEASYGNIPVLRGRLGPSPVGVPPYVLCEVMQVLICASLCASKLGRWRGGSSR